MRVFDYAKKYEVESSDLIKLLKENLGIKKVALSAIDEEVILSIEDDILKLPKKLNKKESDEKSAKPKPSKKSKKSTSQKDSEPEKPVFVPQQVILIKKAPPPVSEEALDKKDDNEKIVKSDDNAPSQVKDKKGVEIEKTDIKLSEKSSDTSKEFKQEKTESEKVQVKTVAGKKSDQPKSEISPKKTDKKSEESDDSKEKDDSKTSKKPKPKKPVKEKDEPARPEQKDQKKSSKGKGSKKQKGNVDEIERREIESPFKNLVIRNGAFKKFTSKRHKSKKSGGRSRIVKEMRRDKIMSRLEKEKRMVEEEENTIKITDPTTPSQLAEQLQVEVNEVLKKLFNLGYMVTINQKLDAEAATLIAEEYDYKVKIAKLFDEEDTQTSVSESSENVAEEDLKIRPPIVTIMGHVDHGKTLLLDVIRDSNVVSQEAGGITQSIGAYKINYKGQDIVFIDTPGHEAFTAMRARGADCTDIVVLIVAADDGVMPQTAEAINHARAAGCPIIVAINKIDKENANINNVKQQLGQHDLLPEDWGGKTTTVEISALRNVNIQDLLEMILLETELLELKCNVDCPAEGIIIESKIEKGLGPVINVLVLKGTLKKGDSFVAGLNYGKVKALIDDHGNRVESVGPSTPIQILGVNGVSESGDPFICVDSDKIAKDISEKRKVIKRQHDLQVKEKVSLEQLFSKENQDVKTLNLIVKTDVAGMSEAIESFLKDIDSTKVEVNIIHSAVGGINENDITLAKASDAIVIGFNVRADSIALQLADREKIEIRYYDIIFKLKEDIIKALEGMLESIKIEKPLGNATVKEIFKISKIGIIAGCFLESGKVLKKCKVRVLRDKVVVYTSFIESLKRHKDDVSEVNAGQDFGVSIKNFDDVKVGDELEFFLIEEKKQSL